MEKCHLKCYFHWLNLLYLHVLFQVVQKCKELGPPEGKYFYKAADMANMSATQLVIKVGHNYVVGHLISYKASR